MRRQLWVLVLVLGFVAPAQAQIWRAVGFLEWFVRNFSQIQSRLELSEAQEKALQAAKKPLGDAVDEAIRVERERVSKMRALFARGFTAAGFEELMRARRARLRQTEQRIQKAAIDTLVAMHRILTPAQRERMLSIWSARIERRYQRYERPLH